MSRVSFFLNCNALKPTNLSSHEPGLLAFLMGSIFGFATIRIIFLISLYFIKLPLSDHDRYCLQLTAGFSRKILLSPITLLTFLYAHNMLRTCEADKTSPNSMFIKNQSNSCKAAHKLISSKFENFPISCVPWSDDSKLLTSQ